MENGVSAVSLDELTARYLKEGYSEEKAERKAREMLEREESAKAAMAPPGALKLPPLLEEKRLKYNIPDCYFQHQATYDRCLCFQLEDSKYLGTTLELADTTKDWQRMMSPKVVIVSAGLLALDNIRSHGIDLGHTVIINQMTPYRFEGGVVNGKVQRILIIRDGDICASEELSRDMQTGRCRVDAKMVKGKDGSEFAQHFFVDKDGKTWDPQTPWIPDDG